MKPHTQNIAETSAARDAGQQPPYTLAQIINNLQTMKDVDDLQWCRDFAADVLERGIDALPRQFFAITRATGKEVA